jgi:hypothetical protein
MDRAIPKLPGSTIAKRMIKRRSNRCKVRQHSPLRNLTAGQTRLTDGPEKNTCIIKIMTTVVRGPLLTTLHGTQVSGAFSRLKKANKTAMGYKIARNVTDVKENPIFIHMDEAAAEMMKKRSNA